MKIILSLFIFLLIDLVKPFGYFLYTEFAFLGVLLVSLKYPLFFSFIAAASLGYLKDCAGGAPISFSIIEFSLIPIVIKYLLSHFHKKKGELFICSLLIFAHIILNNIVMESLTLGLSFLFFIHSVIFLLVIDYFFDIYPIEKTL